jgi:dipeptidyl aminopeptidase/acylaminoacyl peptidase
MWNVTNPEIVMDLLLEPAPVNGRGLSGGVHVWDHDGNRVFVVTKSEGGVEVTLEDDAPARVKRLPFDASRSWSTPAFDYMNRSLFVIADWRELWGCKVGSGDPWLVHASEGFAMDAAAGADGMCLEWQRPQMPWTESTIFPEPSIPNISVQQPRFSPDGTSFGYIDDTRGIANVRILADSVVDHDVIIEDDCEHGGPTWGPGQRTWCFNPDGTRVAYTRNENGFGSLWVYDRVTTERTYVGRGIHGCLSWEANSLSALRSGARTPQQVVVYDATDLSDIQRTILVRPADELWFTPEIEAELVEPSVHDVDNNGITVPYRLYRSVHPPFGLIVWVHGGPIDQWQVTFRPRLTYWLSRGWSIVVVDHRGTTGHSRDFTEALEGQWGSADSSDTHAVLHHVQRVFGYRPERTVLMGGSAGGLTALNTIAIDPDLCAGAVLSYPVVDLGELMRGDDSFETHYMPRLIGAASPDDPLLHTRSPLKWAHRIAKVPVLIFHGDQDHSVSLIHSERLRNVVRAAGGSVRLEIMPGEGHGFRDPLNVIREYSFTEEFLQSLL